MAKGQGLSIHTMLYLLVGIIVMVVVLLIVKNRMSVVKADLDERSEEFKDVCQVKGSGRMCTSASACDTAGGIDLGDETWRDCKLATPVCCQY